MHIVLIDDDYISIFLTTKLLQRENITDSITSFQLPQEAVYYLQNTLPDQVPDVILLDLNMPIMSGWDFLDAIKPFESQLAGRCSIYILTSSLAPSDKLKAEEYSLVTSVIPKPLDGPKLQAIRAQVLENRS
ncbi:response regulator [Hymenobacter qilianensis]|uniref:Response regulator n=2 Tax=Hymenobacter qilianensis TaxID=1385715 RepID=A0ACB5PS91_9BACT|nr:response regulator [Hymenobacter qilianensis]QNP52357.1 response regulator [Hymenobacter qilianensis]GGF66873.1 response regulator [Hymenobacter qilianensis]